MIQRLYNFWPKPEIILKQRQSILNSVLVKCSQVSGQLMVLTVLKSTINGSIKICHFMWRVLSIKRESYDFWNMMPSGIKRYQPAGLCISNSTLGWPYFLLLLFIFKILKIIYLQQDQEDPAIHCVPSSQADLEAPYHQAGPSHHVDLVGPRKGYRCQRNKIEGFRYILLSKQE